MKSVRWCNLGLLDYGEAYQLQKQLVDRRRTPGGRDLFLVVEHPSVYTLGRRGGREHLVVTETFLAEKGIDVVPIERGGVITYHGPGQLVVYPILHLKEAGLSVVDYVHRLEEVMVRLAAEFGVTAVRDERNHGVWVGNSKLGSVGIAIRRGVSFHGLALNVNPDMEPFGWINPCGLSGVAMTSLARESAGQVEMERIIEILPDCLAAVFATDFEEISKEGLEAELLTMSEVRG
jgi:lipoyl(octanoyl) transferase